MSGFRSRHELMFAALRDRDTSELLPSTRPQKILDLGNGRLRPQYLLLKARGHHVFGIDIANRPVLSATSLLYDFARPIYAWKTEIPAIRRVTNTLVCGDVSALPFRSRSFEMVTSIAAIEHFLDIPLVVRELARVSNAGGILWICIHLFTSPSGGHNVTFTQIPMRSVPRAVDPWDHLRKRRLPFSVPLNEWRVDQYLEEFAKHFELLKHYCAMREGEHLLTPELEGELSDYSRDELTCAAYVIVARKPM